MNDQPPAADLPQQRPAPASLPPQAPSGGPGLPVDGERLSTAEPRRQRRWVWPFAVGGALVLGIAIGAGSTGGDATASPELNRLTADRDDLQDAVVAAEERAADAEVRASEASAGAEDGSAALDERAADLDEREAALDEREAQLAERETAVTATEQQAAANQIHVGTWTVGVDVEPGTYRMSEPVTEMCYWGIYRSGTNKADIIDNDLVQGGHPTVTLSEGQDFDNGCGVWDKQ